MSIANLAGGNGEGIVIPEFTADHIFVNKISTKNTGLIEIDSPIATNSINFVLGSPNLTLGNAFNDLTINAANTIINSGNTSIATNTVISSSSIDLPSQITFGSGGSAYTINASLAQQVINYNYSGARVQANAGLMGFRRIGDWVDVHIAQTSIDQVTTAANLPLIITGLPAGYRPTEEIWLKGWIKINQPGGQSFIPNGANGGIRSADIVVSQAGIISLGTAGATDGGTFSTTLGQTCGIQTISFSFCIPV